jgi:uncharacterized protein (TIGR00725 family)
VTGRYVAVVGPAEAGERERRVARRLGELLALRGAVLLCGGLGGVMGAASEGAGARGGITVGLLPGPDRRAGDPSLTVALATGLGELRNGLVVNAADAVVAVGGGWGTLSEVSLALRAGKPVVVVDGWSVQGPPAGDTFLRAASAEEALEALEAVAAGGETPGA